MFLRNGLIFMFGFFVSETAEQIKTKYIITYERKFVNMKKNTSAQSLDIRIRAYAKTTIRSIESLIGCLREMKDNGLYKELGFDTYEDYWESVSDDVHRSKKP